MGQNPVISYPIPPYANVPINAQYFQPRVFVISGISFGATTTVTTSSNHNYVIGQQIRLLFPSKYGCQQLNEQVGNVISIPSLNQIVVNINSIGTNPFISSPNFLPNQSQTQPQIVAIGDVNSGLISSTGRSLPTTTIPGSFINISP